MTSKTVRITFPLWQGGNNKMYAFGARMTEWLAPQSSVPEFEIKVRDYCPDTPAPDRGIVYRQELLQLIDDVHELLNREKPDKVVVFSGDCLVDQAPFAWLNAKYEGEMAVLWIDAHPDVMAPGDYPNAHAMVLRHLLGEGDEEFAAKVQMPVKPSHVMFAGLIEERLTTEEREVLDRLHLRVAGPDELGKSSQSVLDWIAHEKIEYLAIHWDLDVNDYHLFRSLLFAEPECKIDWEAQTAVGRMRLGDVTRLINDVQRATNVVALGITEHFPWDAYNLKEALSTIDIMK